MRPVVSKARGAALILVLMVVGILGLLALQMGLNAKANVSRAERLQQRTEAMLRLQSNEAALVFTLLTEPWVTGRERDTDNPYAKVWNFRGEPFEVDGIKYAIQDIRGLLPVPQNADSTVPLRILLSDIGVEDERARRITDDIVKRQIGDRPGVESRTQAVPWQSIDEWRGNLDLSDDEFSKLDMLVTLVPNADFNPTTAPAAVMATRFQGGLKQSLLDLQARDELDSDSYRRLTGLNDDEFTVFYPGPAMRIRSETSANRFRLKREITLILRPYDYEPLQLWGRRSDVSRLESLP